MADRASPEALSPVPAARYLRSLGPAPRRPRPGPLPWRRAARTHRPPPRGARQSRGPAALPLPGCGRGAGAANQQPRRARDAAAPGPAPPRPAASPRREVAGRVRACAGGTGPVPAEERRRQRRRVVTGGFIVTNKQSQTVTPHRDTAPPPRGLGPSTACCRAPTGTGGPRDATRPGPQPGRRLRGAAGPGCGGSPAAAGREGRRCPCPSGCRGLRVGPRGSLCGVSGTRVRTERPGKPSSRTPPGTSQPLQAAALLAPSHGLSLRTPSPPLLRHTLRPSPPDQPLAWTRPCRHLSPGDLDLLKEIAFALRRRDGGWSDQSGTPGFAPQGRAHLAAAHTHPS